MKNTLLFLCLFFSLITWGQVPSVGLVKEYLFTNGSIENSANPGTYTLVKTGNASSAVISHDLFSNDAISLNGDYFNSGVLGTGNQDVTLSFWIKTSTNDANVRTILSQYDEVGNYGYRCWLQNGKTYFGGSISAAYSFGQTVSTTTISDNNWHHIVLVIHRKSYPGSPYYYSYLYKQYIDGAYNGVGESALVRPPFASINGATDLMIGIRNNLTGEKYEDEIDDIRFYNRVISAAELSNLLIDDNCLPVNVRAENLMLTSAKVLWDTTSHQSSWDLAYVESGQTDTSFVYNVSTNTYTLTNLSANTTYNVYIKGDCSVRVSDWTHITSFTTLEGIFVDASATGANNGSSWTDAFTNLQSALPLASTTNQIWVAAGVYTPDASNRSIKFNILGNTKLYGGFAGTETMLSQRDFNANITTLSGDLLGNDNETILDTEATRQDNSYQVTMIKDGAQNILVDGFTISGGNNNYSAVGRGAAIILSNSATAQNIQAVFSNCILEKNSATNVAVYSIASPSGVQDLSFDTDFKNCIIRNNYSRDLSAMLFYGSNGYGIYSSGSLVNCLFYENVSALSGAALYLGTSTASGGNVNGLHLDIVNSTFVNNSGLGGSTIAMINASKSTISNSIIYGNGSATPLTITTSGSVVHNSIIEGGQQGGIDSDPVFTDAANNDYTIACNSPAINAGDSIWVSASTDLFGQNRIVNEVDMGVYEYQSNFTITSSSDNICEGESVIFATTGLTNISWSSGIVEGVPFYPTINDIYTVTGTDGNTCTHSVEIPVTIKPLPDVTASSDKNYICPGTNVTLSGSGADSYVWDNDVVDGVSFTPSSSNTYIVTGTTQGCSDTSKVEIVVINITDEPVTAGSTAVCSGESTTISVANSAEGADYYLRNEANAIIDGPLDGTGGTLDFNTGTINSQTTFNVYAEKTDTTLGYSLDMDGINDRVNTTYAHAQTNTFSVEAWIYPRSSDYDRLISTYQGVSSLLSGSFVLDTYDASANNGKAFRFTVSGDGNNQFVYSVPNVLTSNAWNHIAAIFDNGVITLYVNAIEVGSSTAPFTTIPGSSATVCLGEDRIVGSGSEFFNGKMDEVRIWNTARTANELATYKDKCLVGNETGLEAYFNFNDGSGNIVAELVNSNNGTMENMDGATDWVDGAVNCPSALCSLEMTEKVTLSPASSYDLTEAVTICSGENYTFADGTVETNITTETIHTSYLQTISTGCDSTITTTVSVHPNYNLTETTAVCTGESYTFPDGTTENNITAQVVYTSNLQTLETGCDSIITTTVNVSPTYNLSETAWVCSGEDYTFPDGTTQLDITSQIVHTSNLQTIGTACDSIIETTLNVNPTYNETETATICSGESYTFPDGTTQANITAQVVYTSNLQTIGTSCDSIITTTVNVNPTYNDTETATICSGESYTFPDGTTRTNITAQVVYTSHLQTTATSCDSIIITTINIGQSYNLSESFSICSGEEYTFPDGTTQSNITSQIVYVSTLQTLGSGCDSIITTTVNVNPTYNETETATICSGESYTFPDGTTETNITAQIVYTSNLQTIGTSCDSIITTTVNVNPTYSETETATICSGENYTFPDGTTQTNITAQVVYISNLQTTGTSCDSIITTTVNVNTIDASVTQNGNTLTANLSGASYQWVDCNNGNIPIASETNQSFTATSNGDFAVVITDGNCSSTSDCFNISLVEVEQVSQQSVSVYPNPASHELTIESGLLTIAEAYIIDIEGRTVQTILPNTNTINIANLPKGIYLLQIQTNDGIVYSRFVKE